MYVTKQVLINANTVQKLDVFSMSRFVVFLHLQEVLRQVRSADKICIDIMCILLLLGLVAVLYGIINNS